MTYEEHVCISLCDCAWCGCHEQETLARHTRTGGQVGVELVDGVDALPDQGLLLLRLLGVGRQGDEGVGILLSVMRMPADKRATSVVQHHTKGRLTWLPFPGPWLKRRPSVRSAVGSL